MTETVAGATREPPAPDARATIPLGVYVHLPWCLKKCPYCDFNSHRAPTALPEDDYVAALCADWRLASAGETRPVASVFFGGGTPSLFSARAIGRVLEALAAHPGLTGDCEITLEANPGASEVTRFAGYRAAGVNRLSLGVQSLDDASLVRLGRAHDAAAARATLADARVAGFERVNADLMFGLPGQSPAAAAADLDALIAEAPSHISYYQLTLEPGTPFYRRPPARADADALADMATVGGERLAAAGYQHYEVSAWAQPGEICRHNDAVWRFGDYSGIGAGAHAKLTAGDGAVTRFARQRWPHGYMQSAGRRAAITEQRTLKAADLRFECLLGGLRRTVGLSRVDYKAHTGQPWAELLDHCQASISAGLLLADRERIATTGRGWAYLDSVLARLLPDQ